MSPLFKKPSFEDREMARIQRRVSPMEEGSAYLTHLYKPTRASEVRGSASGHDEAGGKRRKKEKGGLFPEVRHWLDFWPDVFGSADDRLTNYLSGSFETGRPVRYQRRIRRNRLVVTAVFLGLVVIWAMGRW